VIIEVLERLIGMLQGKQGYPTDNVGVELYFKNYDGLIRAIDEFNYKEVNRDAAKANAAFARMASSHDAQYKDANLQDELDRIFKEKQTQQKNTFTTLLTLMYAHANLVEASYKDEDC
jgi:hypothetical protein